MQITEVKVFLKESVDKKLKAYATITIDNCFVVRNVKVIEGNKGLFVAMPSRKLRDACPKCNYRNAVKSKFCNFCGSNLPMNDKKPRTEEERLSEHRDIAHPITSECREYIQKMVLDAYEADRGKVQRGEPLAAPAPAPAPEKHKDEIETSIAEEGDLEL